MQNHQLCNAIQGIFVYSTLEIHPKSVIVCFNIAWRLLNSNFPSWNNLWPTHAWSHFTSTHHKFPTPVCRQADDMVFVVDASGSISEANFEMVRDFMQEITAYLDVDSGQIRIGLITFSDNPNLKFHLNTYEWDIPSISPKFLLFFCFKLEYFCKCPLNLADSNRNYYPMMHCS